MFRRIEMGFFQDCVTYDTPPLPAIWTHHNESFNESEPICDTG